MDLNEMKENSVNINPEVTEEHTPVAEIKQERQPFTPTIEQGPAVPVAVSMTNGAATAASKHTRQKADMSDLPVPEVEGITDKISPLNEIMEKGGPFDKYRQTKNEQYALQREEAELDMSEEARLSEENELEKEEPVDSTTVEDEREEYWEPEQEPINTNNSYQAIDIMDEAVDDNLFPRDSEETFNNTQEENPIEMETLSGAVAKMNVKNKNDRVYSTEKEDYGVISEDEMVVEKDQIEAADDDISEDEKLLVLKKLISKKIKPVKQRLDLSSFTISKQVDVSNAIIGTDQIPAAKWILPSTGVVFMMKPFSGFDIETIRACIEDRGTGNEDYRTVLNIIYNHIVSPKPNTFEKWVKSVCFFDYEHLFFGMHIASFNGANYIPVECVNTKCTNKIRTYLTDNIPFIDMVKYKNEETEKAMKALYNSEAYDAIGAMQTEVLPITDKIAVGFKMPTLYSSLLEPKYFDTKFNQKYQSTINLLPYIDNIYTIDMNTKSLVPKGYKIYTNNIAKSVKSRVMKYDSILSTLPPDEYNLIGGITSEINEKGIGDITFTIPETTCPFCGTTNPAEEQSPVQMVFTRNRLGLLATI